MVFSACGTPGEPTPPRARVPRAVADLEARQSGNRVVLTFTLPREDHAGQPLREPPQVEIYRAFVAPDSAPQAPTSAPPAYTIPPGVVENYLQGGVIRFEDAVRPEDLAAHAGKRWVYAVRTRVRPGGRRSSEPSNVVAIRVYPSPERVGELRAEVTETAIELRWHAVAAAGADLRYRVYRAELEAAAAGADAAPKAPPALVAVTPEPFYRDPQFEFGRKYRYAVSSMAAYNGDSVESEPSPALDVEPQDTFPPAAPSQLVVVLVPATGDAPARLELSWGISAETDLAGYHVYRSEQEGAPGERTTTELLPTPAFRDMWVAPGRRYFYAVTAVDRAGNESPRSAVAAERVPERPPEKQ